MPSSLPSGQSSAPGGSVESFTPLFRADGVSQSEFVLGEAEGRSGQQVRSKYFPAGAGTPAVIMATPQLAEAVLAAAAAVDGVASVAPASGAGVPAAAAGEPAILEAEGREWVELAATLAYSPDSAQAIAAITALREAVRQADPDALVGGTTAADLDTRTTTSRDLLVIIPIVLAVVTLLLILLLRSLVAPLILISTTVISFLSTLGISALVFNYIFGFPGADATVPLFAFVFLVALGIDYNIFLTSRIREEALRSGTRPGILKGLRVTGGVITSAGVVLAATFAALAVIPILFLVQLAFIVALGVLLDTFVVRSLLVPGLLYDIGPPIWWPSRHAEKQETAGGLAPAVAPSVDPQGTRD
jgi:RND superfamily putative drug exporter